MRHSLVMGALAIVTATAALLAGCGGGTGGATAINTGAALGSTGNGANGVSGVRFSASNGVGSSADLSLFPASTMVDYILSTTNLAQLTATTGSSAAGRRALAVRVDGPVAVGQSVSLNVGNDATALFYSEGSGDSGETWQASSGTVKLLSRSATGARVEITNAHLEPAGGIQFNSAVGSFDLSATIEKK